MVYILHWLGSTKDTVAKGNTISEAFTMAGYGAGAIRALDYYDEMTEEDYEKKKAVGEIFVN